MVAVLPLITSQLANKSFPLPTPPVTPPKLAVAVNPPTPLSPELNQELELHACIGDFLKVKGIDLSASEDALMELELMPDIITNVPVSRLCEVTGVVEGCIHKFQVFCKTWNAHQEKKRAHCAGL